MFQLDEDFLAQLGLANMPADEKEAFLVHLYEELELRVGTELSKGLTDQQLAEFERLVDGNDEKAAVTWLEQNCPNYRQVVAAELKKLKQEIINGKDVLLGEAA